jgi:hypothetical protein
MPIELQDDTRESLPALKLPNVGDAAVFHIVDVGEAEIRNFDTGEAETWPDGNKKMQKVITALLISSAGGAKAGTRDEPLTPTPGEVYTIWAGASGSYHWREGVKAFRKKENRGPAVGDVVKWELEREEPAKQRGMNPHKVRTFAIRAPKADEMAGVKAAEAAHMARTTPTVVDDAPAPAYSADEMEQPF